MNLKYLFQLGMMNVICLMYHILFQTFRIILNILLKIHETIACNLPVQIYANKTKNTRISCNNEIARKYKKRCNKDKEGKNVPELESVEVFLVHCNLVKNNYQQASKVLFIFVPDKQFGQLIIIAPHSVTMLKPINAEFLLKYGLQIKIIDHLK